MERAVRAHLSSAFLAMAVVLAAILTVHWDAATQSLPPGSRLIAADPPPNAILSDTPDRIVLTFSEAINVETASIRLLGSGGLETALVPLPLDGENLDQIAARPSGLLGGGDYVILWSARTLDGTLLSGAYPFRTGAIENPGAAVFAWQWPSPWATPLRALVFLGTALATGGFAWSRLLASNRRARSPSSLLRGSVMTGGALIALLATLLPPLLQPLDFQMDAEADTLAASLRALPLGWWVQFLALTALVLLCLGALLGGRVPAKAAAPLDWTGLAVGLTALVGLSFTSHAAASRDGIILAWEVAHQWSSALWFAGLCYLVMEWRALGSDIGRFRTVRWLGGALIGIAVLTGIAVALPSVSSLAALLTTRYGQVLSGKSVFVLFILALGLLTLVVPRRANARHANSSLTAQGLLGLVTILFAAVLALLASPRNVTPSTLSGVDLVDSVRLDANAFGASNGLVHLLTQLGEDGPQTIVLRLTDENGMPLAPSTPPDVQVAWTPMASPEPSEIATRLQPDASGSLFTGALALAASPWWRADVVITPPGGITSLARFWLILPDPNLTGRGPDPQTDPAAQETYNRARAAMSDWQSVRLSQRLNRGDSSFARSLTALRAAGPNQPAASSETALDAAGNILSQQRVIGERRWILTREEGWREAEPLPAVTPATLAESYARATGFQLGPREDVDGERCQVITFWQPPDQQTARPAAWYVWWVGLASGQVRREVMISSAEYVVTSFSDFNAPLDIPAPAPAPDPEATPSHRAATPMATPAG